MSSTTDNDIPDGLSLRWTLSGHTADIYRVNWSPRDDMLVSPSQDRTTRIWKDGESKGGLKDSAALAVAAAWSPDGKRLAMAAGNDVLRLWDVAAGKAERTRTGGLGQVTSVAFSPDGKSVATGSLSGMVRFWDAEFKDFRLLVKKSSDKIFCLGFSKRSPLLAVGCESGTIRLWNTDDMSELPSLSGHEGPIYSLVFFPGKSLLASAGEDKSIRFWDPMEGKQTARLDGHTAPVHSISISAGDDLLASKSGDGTVRIWSTEIEESVASFKEYPGKTWLSGLAFHPTEPLLATLGEEVKVIRVWHVDADALLGGP